MYSESHRPSRLATVFVVVGLALSAVGIAYLVYAGRPRELPPLPESTERVQEAHALMRMLMHSFGLFLAFLFGSYLMVVVGRRIVRRRQRRERSEYVDAWGSYRLTDEQIAAAERQLRESFPSQQWPGDVEPDSPEEPS